MRRKPKRMGREPKYPWVKWIGTPGHKQRLLRGRDFDCQPHGFSVLACTTAFRLGYRLSVLIQEENGKTIVLLENKGRVAA